MHHLSHGHDHGHGAGQMLNNAVNATAGSAFAAFLNADQHMTRIYAVRPPADVRDEPVINQSSR